MMKTIQRTKRLQLNKETLRALSADQLQVVNGGSAFFCVPTLALCPSDLCTTDTGNGGVKSQPQVGCGSIILPTTGLINPQNP